MTLVIGYARTSTSDQQAGLEAQQRDLRAAGCRKIFSEQMSSIGTRAQLEAALDYCREGDTLVVTKLDRLARSARHLSELVDKLEANGVALRILDFSGNGVDTRGATGRLMLNMFAAMAQFEREMMLERQRRASPKQRRKGNTRVESPLLGLRLKMRFASLRRAKRSLTSRASWESGAEASTAHLKARVKPVRA